MAYIIGVSSGFSDIYFGKGGGSADISSITLSGKSFYGALKGVNFTQIDLETGVEFLEPKLKERIDRIKALNLSFGIHGEIGKPRIALDSALEIEYRDSHIRFVRNLHRSKQIGAKYFLLHSSESLPITRVGEHMQPSSIVDIWGRRFHIFLEENPDILEWAINDREILELTHAEYYIRDIYRKISELKNLALNEEKIQKELEKLEEERKRILKNAILDFSKSESMVFGPERIAYILTAKWMDMRKDPIWLSFVGDKKFEEVRYNYRIWVPAVSSKYIYGHFHPEKCKSDLPNFMKSVDLSGKKIDSDPKRYLNKDFIYVIETPMVEKGMEEESRLAAPSDIIKLCKNIDTPFVKAVIDFEHTLGAGIDIENEINKLSNKDGEYIKVLHVGFPTPLQPGHIPIPMGSEQQEWLYEWMYKLRKKGFDSKEDRYIIFERAGGDDPIQQSVLALRKIIEFLEKDIPPEKLPPEFYGITESNLKMQEVEIREHAFDPIKNLFVLPEESHTFLSRNAIEKGKGKEWGAEKYR